MSDMQLDTWADAIDAFPLTGDPEARLRALVAYAVRAPSSHNSQPWRFSIDHGALRICADRRRALPVVDPDDRELVISCGAAIEFLAVAARHFGHEVRIDLLPDPVDPDFLAQVRLGDGHQPTLADEAMFAAIPRRRTHRARFDASAPPPGTLRLLAETAASAGTHLAFLSDFIRKASLASLVMDADRVQMAEPAFRHELARWMRPNASSAVDGMPGRTLGLGDGAALLAPLVVRTFDLGSGRAARDRDLAEWSPVLAVLSTPGDTRRDWLVAGMALTRVLLLACDAGLQASFLNQPIEVPRLRGLVTTVAHGVGVPQLILRFGYASPGPPSPRRPVADVFE
jgi:nitroreductase